MLLAAAGVCLPAGALPPRPPEPSSQHSARTRKKHRRTVRRRHHYRRRHYYRSRYRYRLSRLHPHPERIREIQRALNQKGYLAEEPTGRWDDSTRAAMRHFQQANGFDVTGLPEAKALMKLGLGPHPLPPGLSNPPDQATAAGSPTSDSNDPPAGHPPRGPQDSTTHTNDQP